MPARRWPWDMERFGDGADPAPCVQWPVRLPKIDVFVGLVAAGGCLALTPNSTSPVQTSPVQIWLRLAPGDNAASLLVISPEAAAGTINYLAAVLVPPQGPTTSVPLELVVPTRARAT